MKLEDLIASLPAGFIEAVCPPGLDPDDDDEEMKLKRLQIALMFPLVSEVSRNTLLVAELTTQIYTLAVRTQRDALSGEDIAKQERATNAAGEEWMQIQPALELMLKTELFSDAQRDWIQRHLMTPPEVR